MRQKVRLGDSDNQLQSRFQQVTLAIATTCREANRADDSVDLLAVSKAKPREAIAELAQVGQRHFGENYLQEAIPKIEHLSSLQLVWHFIGSIQSNKSRDIAKNFDWVHTVDRERVARRLNDARSRSETPLNVCIQVNVDDEPQKSGTPHDRCEELATLVDELPYLSLRGLMVIPKPLHPVEDMRHAFARTKQLFDALKQDRPDSFDTLSMGMTEDYAIAIDEGATMIRLGTALFGPRR